MSFSTRTGLNLLSTTNDITTQQDINQSIYQRIAIAKALSEMYGGAEGFISGGARVIGDITTGTTYPAYCLLMEDDNGEAWFFNNASTTTIDFSNCAGAAGTLYAIIDLSPSYTPIAAKGNVTDVTFAVYDDADPAPAHSLVLGTGNVALGALTTFTPTAGTFLSINGEQLVLPDTVDNNTATIKVGANLAANRIYSFQDAGASTDIILGTLVATRIPFASAVGVVTDSANLAYDSVGNELELGSATKILFGTDANTANLYRSANDTLKTDDKLIVDSDFTVNGNTTLGNANTDTITCTGRLSVRTVDDAGPMTATAGTLAEVVYNSANSKFYGCITAGNPATWSALN